MKNTRNQTTILLIENDSDWLVDIYSVLHEAGYDVLIATGGDEGFCLARRVRPDLIVCEAALTDISGVQLCYMIRADKNLRAAQVVLIGGQDDTAFESFRAGADDYFEKNGSLLFLQAKITRLIEIRRAENDLRRRSRELRRSEQHLMKIIEDTSNLVAVLEPKLRFVAFGKCEKQKSKGFFGSSVEPESNADGLENWKQSLQSKELAETNKFVSREREKVYYEVVC